MKFRCLMEITTLRTPLPQVAHTLGPKGQVAPKVAPKVSTQVAIN